MENTDFSQVEDLRKHFELELEIEREIARSDLLAPFRRNATSWEFLLTLAAQGGETGLGLYNTLDRLETGFLGQSSMLKFLRECRKMELLTFNEHEKRSKWRISLAPDVHTALARVYRHRNRSLNRLHSDADEGYQDDGQPVEEHKNGKMR